MANTRIKDLSNTATNVASDAFIAIDGNANGTEKISRDNLRQDTADALAAAPSTYNLAPLTSGSVDVDKGGTGSTTVAGAKTNLEIPTLGTAANEVPVNGMLNSGAWVDWDSHYSEGTWTPTVSFGGSSTGVLYSLQEGSYTKIGDTVYVTAVMTLSDKGSSHGNAKLEGLPFAAKAATISGQALNFSYANNMTGLTSALTGLLINNNTTVAIYNWSSTGAASTTDGSFTDTTSLRFSATYQIA